MVGWAVTRGGVQRSGPAGNNHYKNLVIDLSCRQGGLRGMLEATGRLLLKCHLSPGDVVMLTAAVRDLHRAHPGKFLTAIETTAGELWEHNPLISTFDSATTSVRTIEMHYPLINQSNTTPYHFVHGFA
ncbi:MAG TPA: hypothetical protein VGM98_06305, partial [Schlesneria sp.]